MKSEAPTPLPGLLEAMRRESISLRDLFAGLALAGLASRDRVNPFEEPVAIAECARALADEMIEQRASATETAGRTERLASIGEEVVDWATTSGNCYLCTRLPNGAHASTCPVGEYLVGEQRRDTDPSPAEPEITVDRTDFDPFTCPPIAGDFNGPHGPLPIGHDELEPAKESKR